MIEKFCCFSGFMYLPVLCILVFPVFFTVYGQDDLPNLVAVVSYSKILETFFVNYVLFYKYLSFEILTYLKKKAVFLLRNRAE